MADFSDSNTAGRISNRLAREKSPYLLQHAENPVDWFAWGEEAFQKAREEDKPVFLSIGYATCHWCHVMAHESFEDEDVSRLLNQSFISIKVDREERPDVDQVYMNVCQALTGQGGWPLSVFITPEKIPFFAGTYFPKSGRPGLIGFTDLLSRIANLWRTNREALLKSGRQILHVLRSAAAPVAAELVLDEEILKKAFAHFSRVFDETNGGFGRAPKFPTPHHLTFLLRWFRRSRDPRAAAMVEKTLAAMRQGGIFDQIGYGFHRYSVDEGWLVPHFEKMLYDQALLAMAYTEAFQALGKEEYGRTAKEIFSYVLRDMTSAEGAFYSAEDADSEGEEGRFYVWTPREIKKILGADLGDLFCRSYDITPEGNFENGTSIPHRADALSRLAESAGRNIAELEDALETARGKLFQARAGRVHPLKDDKVLTSWNGLMIAALAKGSQALGNPSYAGAARRAADFLLEKMRARGGTLYRRYRNGDLAHAGYAEDYAFLVWGLLELYESLFDPKYLEEALHLTRIMIELFEDEENGGFYFTGKDHEALISRNKETYDGAIPSGNSVAAGNLLRLARLTGKFDLEDRAERLFRSFSATLAAAPMSCTQLLAAVDFRIGPAREIVIAGDPEEEDTQAVIAAVQRTFLPNKVLLVSPPGEAGKKISALAPFLAGMRPRGEKPTLYLCEGHACRNPLTDLAEIRSALE